MAERLHCKLYIDSLAGNQIEGTLEFVNWGHGVFGNETIEIEFHVSNLEDILKAVKMINSLEYDGRKEVLDFLYEELEFDPTLFDSEMLMKWIKENIETKD